MNFTKEESITWINHALSFYKSLGKKQKDFAVDFGLEESRVSELKNPDNSLKISPSQMKKIVDLCGAPRRGPGRFEYAEIYDSVEEFFTLFIPVTRNRYLREVYKKLTNQEVINYILDNCISDNNEREEKATILNNLVRSKAFRQLLSEQNDSDGRVYELSDAASEVIGSYNISTNDAEVFGLLCQLSYLIDVAPNFYLGGSKGAGVEPLVSKIPLVITGNRIIAFMSDNTGFYYPVNSLINRELRHLKQTGSVKGLPSVKRDNWTAIRVEVYLSENMNYHILVHMSETTLRSRDVSYVSDIIEGYDWCNYDAIRGDRDRIVVIKNVNTLEIFSKIEELRKWQGLPEDNLYELKQKIANAGGHVAGAYVLR